MDEKWKNKNGKDLLIFLALFVLFTKTTHFTNKKMKFTNYHKNY